VRIATSRIEGPIETDIRIEVEAVLRSLPMWFGQEDSLQEYVADTFRLPTFTVRDGGRVTGFVTLKQHFEFAWEIHCIAVHAAHRNGGYGTALVERIRIWLLERGARLLQVKTMAESADSPEYDLTRGFYLSQGFLALEYFPDLWTADFPCLQLVKILAD
jgi:GNAT superfamily N-acetyltransferase